MTLWVKTHESRLGLQPLLPGLCGFVSQNRVLQLCIPKASLLSVRALMTGAGEACLTSRAAGVISGNGPSTRQLLRFSLG